MSELKTGRKREIGTERDRQKDRERMRENETATVLKFECVDGEEG